MTKTKLFRGASVAAVAAVGFAYDRGTNVFSSAQRNLAGGGRLVKIVVRDGAGLTATRVWGFRVAGDA